jgi:uncharacterized DUF497 family protein
VEITFDPEKDRANRQKHGVSLAFAPTILADPERLDILDVRFDYTEERIVTYGRVDERVWVCVHASRATVRRIISVRKANDRETKRYQQSVR